jgi:hypothetical protein
MINEKGKEEADDSIFCSLHLNRSYDVDLLSEKHQERPV